MGDDEALIQLIVGNIQTENRPLEIGLNALELVQKDSKKGLSVTTYAEKIGLNKRTVRAFINSAEVYKFIQEQSATGCRLLTENAKLELLSRCPQSDWLWLHDLVVEKELSKVQTEQINKTGDLGGGTMSQPSACCGQVVDRSGRNLKRWISGDRSI